MRLHQLHTIFHIYRNLTVFLYSIHLIFSALLSNLDFSIDLPHNVIPCNAMPCHAMLCYVTHPHTYVLTAAEALRQRKYDVHTHKSPHKNPSKTSTRTITTNSTTPTITSVNVTNRSTTTIVKQRDQQQPLQYNNKSNHNSNNAIHNSNCCHNSYAMPTETFLLKQKAAMLAASSANTNSNTSATVVVRKKPLSPLQIIALPHNATLATPSPNGTATETTAITATTAHQLSHQLNAQQHPTDVGIHRQQQLQHTGHITQTLQRRPSPLLGAPLSPYAIARSPLSPCASPHYVRPTKASRLRAAALGELTPPNHANSVAPCSCS